MVQSDPTIETYISALSAEHNEELVAVSYSAITTRGAGYFRKTFWDRNLNVVRFEVQCISFLANFGVNTLKFHPSEVDTIFHTSNGKGLVGYKTMSIMGRQPEHIPALQLAEIVAGLVYGFDSFVKTIDCDYSQILPRVDCVSRSRACALKAQNSEIDASLTSSIIHDLKIVEGDDSACKLIHGDLALRNILCDENSQCIHLIDFSDMCLGTLEYELGRLVSTLLVTEISSRYLGDLLSELRKRNLQFDILKLRAYVVLHRIILSVILENEPLDALSLGEIYLTFSDI